MIYLDNASTTLKKPLTVYYSIFKTLLFYNANAGRSGHNLSVRAGFEVYKAREALSSLFNCDADHIIFTSGCTEALNLAILGSVKEGGHIIASAYEHNSVLRVLKHLEKQGKITFSIINPQKSGQILISDYEKEIKKNTYMIIANHISNVLGVKTDIESLGKLAKKHNLSFLVDTAQSAGHEQIDMQKCNITMLAFAGHKGLLGLSGVGGLALAKDKVRIVQKEGYSQNQNSKNGKSLITLQPIKFGGTGMNSEELDPPIVLPESFECGTLPLVNIASLKAGVKYVQNHFDKINEKIKSLTFLLINDLKQNENIVLYTPINCLNGVVAFNVKGYSSMEICDYLNEKYKICVRSGLTCAPLVHQNLGTSNSGVVRVSIAHYNKKSHINKLIKALNSLNKR